MQTLSSASFGYSNVRTNCVHCAALGGKVTTKLYTQAQCLIFDISQIAAGWGSNVAIFQPTSTDGVGKVMTYQWYAIMCTFDYCSYRCFLLCGYYVTHCHLAVQCSVCAGKRAAVNFLLVVTVSLYGIHRWRQLRRISRLQPVA